MITRHWIPKFIVATALLAWVKPAPCSGAWLESFNDAIDLATRGNKTILLDFTGSDWCPCCKKMDEDALSQPYFLNFAAEHLVLLKVDFPRSIPQSAGLVEINQRLQNHYEVTGYPTLINIKPDGSVIWKQVGYPGGGATALVDHLIKASPQLQALAKESAPSAAAPAPVAVRNPPAGPKLQGICFSSHPTAMIDGQNCREGDVTGDTRVIKIYRDRVTVEWKGKTRDLEF